MENFKNLNMMPFFQEYEQQLKAYGIPIQSFDWKQIPTTTTANVLVKISLNFFALRRNKLECLSLASFSSLVRPVGYPTEECLKGQLTRKQKAKLQKLGKKHSSLL
jgi:hypothetical protein